MALPIALPTRSAPAQSAWGLGRNAQNTPSASAQAIADLVSLSDEGRKMRSGSGRTILTTSTDMGSQLTLTARTRGGSAMSMGRAASMVTEEGFSLSGQGKGKDIVDYTATFTHADGTIQTFDMDATTQFYQHPDGTVYAEQRTDKQPLQGQSILVNVADGAQVKGSECSDLIVNVGLGATIDASGGDDTIISMGDEVKVSGGTGDDTVQILEDVLKRQPASTKDKAINPALNYCTAGAADPFAELNKHYDDEGNIIRPSDSQSVTVDGGEDDDTIFIASSIFESNISGGEGDDKIEAADVMKSTIDGGGHDDVITLRNVMNSQITGGSGDDHITAQLVKNTVIRGDSGNDFIEVRGALGSMLLGGAGDDKIRVRDEIRDTLIDGGDGNDTISLAKVEGSRVEGGEGDDTITVERSKDSKESYLNNSVIKGGAGNDTISVKVDKLILGQSTETMIQGNEGDDVITVTAEEIIIPPGGNALLVDGGSGDDKVQVSAKILTEEGQQSLVADEIRKGNGARLLDRFIAAGNHEDKNPYRFEALV